VANGYVGGTFAVAVGSEPEIHIYQGGFDFGVSGLIGFPSQFPGRDGGNWHGLEIRALGGLYAGGIVYPSTGAALLTFKGSIAVAYEFLHFGSLDRVYSQQGGIGAFVGPRVGFNVDGIISAAFTGGAEPTVGAIAGVVFPNFNSKTMHLSRGILEVGFETLPGTGLTFFTVGGGGAL